ncbi:hypothetical protein [Desulfonatronum parangueonense]
MKKSVILVILLASLSLMQIGCGRFTGGAATGGAVGVLGTGAAYEYQTKRQLDQLEADLAAGRITQEEYDIRRDQISRGSIIY